MTETWPGTSSSWKGLPWLAASSRTAVPRCHPTRGQLWPHSNSRSKMVKRAMKANLFHTTNEMQITHYSWVDRCSLSCWNRSICFASSWKRNEMLASNHQTMKLKSSNSPVTAIQPVLPLTRLWVLIAAPSSEPPKKIDKTWKRTILEEALWPFTCSTSFSKFPNSCAAGEGHERIWWYDTENRMPP